VTAPLAFLRATLDAAESIARAAGGRSEQVWKADLSGKDPLGQPSWPMTVRYVTDGQLRGAVANLPIMEERSEDRMRHIALHDPAAALRRIAADRKLIEDLARIIGGDYIDDGELPLAEHVLRLIAEGWGWTEETT
jgi:hypothetical protein